MGWNGSGSVIRSNGTYTGTNVWEQDKNAAVKIVTSRHDAHDEDMADAIENTIAKDGQNAPTANLPMGGFKHTNVAVASARTDYARASQVQDSALIWGGTTGGTANAQTLTLSPAITAYTTGARVRFIAGATNTAACTININSVGANTIKKNLGSTDLAAGDIFTGGIYEIVYNGTNWVLADQASRITQDWTASGLTASGSMTVSSISVSYAKYAIIAPQLVFMTLHVSFTLGGTPSTAVNVPLPVAGAALTNGQVAYSYISDGGVTGGISLIGSGGSVAQVFRENQGNWSTGASRVIYLSMTYMHG